MQEPGNYELFFFIGELFLTGVVFPALFFGIVFFVRWLAGRFARRWAEAYISRYSSADINLEINQRTIDAFAGMVAMAFYAFFGILLIGANIALLYIIRQRGFNPNIEMAWLIYGVPAVAMLLLFCLYSWNAYRTWKASLLELNKHLELEHH